MEPPLPTSPDLPDYRTLRFKLENSVATITLDRPQQRNAFGDGMGAELPAALELARDIAVNTAPMSVAASKRLLWDSFDLDRHAVGARETEIHLRLMGHDDAREGVRAHTERRDPRWTGRPVDPTN